MGGAVWGRGGKLVGSESGWDLFNLSLSTADPIIEWWWLGMPAYNHTCIMYNHE